ncbi:MAG: efflux RND transporter periplasmic adaptor subunit [Acidobacteria bacterium]|nr:efflux RND transporter periplasmic adaptor subunit [Acidobacteriota bacterium]
MSKKLIIAIVVIGIAGMIILGAVSKRDSGLPVFMEKVKTGPFKDTINASGLLIPRKKVSIMSDVMGKIIELPVKEGDLVKKGQILVRIDDRDLKSEVQRQEAGVKMAEIQVKNQQVALDTAKREFKRKKHLFKQQLISRESFEQARSAMESAELTLEQYRENVVQSRAILKKSKELLSKTVIRSPMNGKITALNKELGEQVIQGTINVPGSVIMEVSDMSAIDLEVEVNEIEAARIRKNMAATVKLDALPNRKFKGEIFEIGQSAYRPQGRDVSVFKIKIALLELDPAMKPGMNGEAEITVQKKQNTLFIPIQAVRTDDNGNKFCFIMKNRKAVKKTIKTGLSNDADIEITKGLSGGETVITGPYRILKNLKNGDKVRKKKKD